MGTWQVPADVLASSGFGISPKAEVVGALGALIRPRSPEKRAFSAAHRAAFAQRLTDHPTECALVRASFREASPGLSGWVANYLADPAEITDPTFEDEIALLGTLSVDDLRGRPARDHPRATGATAARPGTT